MRGRVSILFVIALATAACDNSGSSSTTTSPSVPLMTETFSGTVPLLSTHDGFDIHNFTSAQNGEVDITLSAAGPPSTISMGLGIGTPGAAGTSTCSLFSGFFGSTPAGPSPQIAASANAGTYCVKVYDVGNALADIAYTVTVAHP